MIHETKQVLLQEFYFHDNFVISFSGNTSLFRVRYNVLLLLYIKPFEKIYNLSFFLNRSDARHSQILFTIQ